MASSHLNIFLFSLVISVVFFLLSLESQALIPPPTALTLPIRKDTTTLQYYTTLEISNGGSQVNLVLDLAGQQLWFYCPDFNLPSYNPISCDDSKCETFGGLGGCISCNGPASPGCSNNTCGTGDFSPYSGVFVGEGFGEDFLYVASTDGRRVMPIFKSPYPLTLSCSNYQPLYEGLASQIKGLVGLSRSNIGLPTLLATAYKLARKFSLCLPSSTKLGSIIIGGGPYYLPPTSNTDLSKSLISTPLLINPNSTAPAFTPGDASEEYFLDVKSITIDNTVVSFKDSLLSFDKDGFGGTKLSTTTPYTILHTNIYKPFVRAFEKAASDKKIKKVDDVAPFGACFDSNTIGKTAQTGPDVPIINLVLGGKNAEWKIYGANSIVEVTKGVSCLAFVDGGKNPRTSVVLGGKQLENYFLEIDIASSKLGFTSLLLKGTTCSHPVAAPSTWAV